MREMEEEHKGEYIANLIFECLSEYQIVSKLGWTVTDNASNNFTAMKFLAQKIPSFTPEERHNRCLNHVINLAVNALINAISHIEIQDFDEIDKPVIKKRRVSLYCKIYSFFFKSLPIFQKFVQKK